MTTGFCWLIAALTTRAWSVYGMREIRMSTVEIAVFGAAESEVSSAMAVVFL